MPSGSLGRVVPHEGPWCWVPQMCLKLLSILTFVLANCPALQVSQIDGIKLCTYFDFSPFIIFSDRCHIQSVESGSSIIFADLTSQEKKSCDSTSLRNLGSESVQNMDVRNDFTNSNSKECMKPNKCELSVELQEDSVSSVSSRSTDVKNHSSRGPHSSLDQDASTGIKSCAEECSKNDVALCGEFEVNTVLFKYT